jgi:hypothetical protein
MDRPTDPCFALDFEHAISLQVSAIAQPAQHAFGLLKCTTKACSRILVLTQGMERGFWRLALVIPPA